VCQYSGSAWAAVGGTGAVSSVFTRTGAVVAAANDYAFNQAGNPTGNQALDFDRHSIDPADFFITTGGTGYTALDVVTVVAGDNNATFRVDTVDGSGSVQALTLLSGGTGYSNGDALTTGGTGTGLELNYTTLGRTITWNFSAYNSLVFTSAGGTLFRFDPSTPTFDFRAQGGPFNGLQSATFDSISASSGSFSGAVA